MHVENSHGPCCCRLYSFSSCLANGAYSVVEIISQPGDSTPMHVHKNEDEHFLILEGIARVVRGDETFDAPAGATIALPRHIPHAWGNATNSTLRMIATCWPGG